MITNGKCKAWSKWGDSNSQLLAPKASRLPIDLHLDFIFISVLRGRSGEARTPSLLLPKQAVYQLAYTSNYLRLMVSCISARQPQTSRLQRWQLFAFRNLVFEGFLGTELRNPSRWHRNFLLTVGKNHCSWRTVSSAENAKT